MDSHAIVTEAGSLVLAALACIADNSIPILALTVVSWLITSAIASEKLTTTCTSLVLDFAGTAARHYRLIENGLEEVWYTVAEAPEDAAAYLKRAVVSLTPMVVRDFVVRSASFRVEAGHLVHAIGFFVLFFRLAPGSDKKRFQRSWSLATAVYLASVDWFVLATAKIVALAVESLESAAGLPTGDCETGKGHTNHTTSVSEQLPKAGKKRGQSLRIVTSPRSRQAPTKNGFGLSPRRFPIYPSPVRAKSSRKLTPTKRGWTSEEWAPPHYSPIKFRRDLAKFRRDNHRGAIGSPQYRRTWKLYGYRPSPIDTRPELWDEVLKRSAPRPAPQRQWTSDLEGSTQIPSGAKFSPVDPSKLPDRNTPLAGTFREV